MGWGLARLSYLTPTQILSGWESWTSTRGSGAETFDFVLTFVPLKNESLQRMYDWEFLNGLDGRWVYELQRRYHLFYLQGQSTNGSEAETVSVE